MSWKPYRRALFRVCRAAYHGWGRFKLIDELGIPRVRDKFETTYGCKPDEALYTERYLAVKHMASFLGREAAPCEKDLRQKLESFPRGQGNRGLPFEVEVERSNRCYENLRTVKRELMPRVDREVLPPRWKARGKRKWAAETPLCTLEYGWEIDHKLDASPLVSLRAEADGEREDAYPPWLFCIADWTSVCVDSFLAFHDLEDFERRYRGFLSLLNASVDELCELGERYLATGRFD